MKHLPDLLKFLESRGFTFALDAQGQLDFDYPRRWRRLAREVLLDQDLREAIVWRLQFRRECARRQFSGGPLDGHLHERVIPGQIVTYHVARSRWAVYVLDNDFVARFVGYAASRKKAARLWREPLSSGDLSPKGGDPPSTA